MPKVSQNHHHIGMGSQSAIHSLLRCALQHSDFLCFLSIFCSPVNTATKQHPSEKCKSEER